MRKFLTFWTWSPKLSTLTFDEFNLKSNVNFWIHEGSMGGKWKMEILKLPLFTHIWSILTNSLKSLIKCSQCYLKYENMKCEIWCKYWNMSFGANIEIYFQKKSNSQGQVMHQKISQIAKWILGDDKNMIENVS